MKKCAVYVCFRTDAKHPFITDQAHAAGTKLDILTHASFATEGAPVLGKNFAKLIARKVAYGIAKEKGENNQWQPPLEFSPKNGVAISLAQTIDMLVAKWVERLQSPPDAFEVWLLPLKTEAPSAEAARLRYRRKKGGFEQALEKAPVPQNIAALRA